MAGVIAAWFSLLARVSLAAAMIVLQAFTPLLHAHLGTSQVHGWHIHLQPAYAFNSHSTAHATDAESSLTASDAPEIDVERGVPASQPKERDFDNGQWALIAVLAVAAGWRPLPVAVVPSVPAGVSLTAPRWRPPNSPPPALAPPLHS
ncbi:hypothetical protein [Cupriavidus laharis]|uniref:hypothetical protein n=1 Tax=Cupriavidus laharis TaxID=151654 RepID=UPI001CC7FE6F|nr:hypothetical protein [Cupriavidus laharis]